MADPYFKFVVAQFRATTMNRLNLDSSIPRGWFARPTVNSRGNSPTVSNEHVFLNPYSFKFVKPQVINFEQSVDYGTVVCDPARFGSSDFTIEGRIYATSIATGVCFIESWSSTNGWLIFINTNGTIHFKEKNLAISLVSLIGGPLFTINTDHHIAVTRTGSVLRLFLDGVKIAETTLLTAHAWTVTSPITICVGGQWNSRNTAYDLGGYADDIRITKEISRYTADFTPPVASDFEEYDLNSGKYYSVPDYMQTKFFAPETPIAGFQQSETIAAINDTYVGAYVEGDGEIYDTLTIDDLPVVRKATLIDRDSKIMVRQVTSNAEGIFHIKGINKDLYYMLIGEDLAVSNPKRNAVIRDFVRCIPKIIIVKKPITITNGVVSENYVIKAINFTVPVTVTLASTDDITFSTTTMVIKPENKFGYFNILAATSGNKTITMTNDINANNPVPLVVAVS